MVPLLPGDVVFTGTPAGVGLARRAPRFLQPGEQLVSRIEGVGEMRHTFRSAAGARRGGGQGAIQRLTAPFPKTPTQRGAQPPTTRAGDPDAAPPAPTPPAEAPTRPSG